LDANHDEFLEMVNQPCFVDDRIPDHLCERSVADFLDHVIAQPLDSARRRPRHGSTAAYEANLRRFTGMHPASRMLERVIQLAGVRRRWGGGGARGGCALSLPPPTSSWPAGGGRPPATIGGTCGVIASCL